MPIRLFTLGNIAHYPIPQAAAAGQRGGVRFDLEPAGFAPNDKAAFPMERLQGRRRVLIGAEMVFQLVRVSGGKSDIGIAKHCVGVHADNLTEPGTDVLKAHRAIGGDAEDINPDRNPLHQLAVADFDLPQRGGALQHQPLQGGSPGAHQSDKRGEHRG